MEAADNFLSKRDAMDVAMIFQSEKELDQSLYFIVMHYKIRYVTYHSMAMGNLNKNKEMRSTTTTEIKAGAPPARRARPSQVSPL